MSSKAAIEIMQLGLFTARRTVFFSKHTFWFIFSDIFFQYFGFFKHLKITEMIVRVRISKSGGIVLRKFALHRCSDSTTVEKLAKSLIDGTSENYFFSHRLSLYSCRVYQYVLDAACRRMKCTALHLTLPSKKYIKKKSHRFLPVLLKKKKKKTHST